MGRVGFLSRERPARPLAATFGNFDGIHRGHAKLIDAVKKNAGAELAIALISLHPHPSVIFRHVENLERILSVSEMRQILGGLGVEYLIYIHFDKAISSLSYDEFINHFLLKTLDVRYLATGPDARMGKDALGTIEKIGPVINASGGRFETLPFVVDEEEATKLSSRTIRTLIHLGDLVGAARALGRRFLVQGKVIHGEGRGKKLNVPTMNIHFSPHHVMPPYGVYVVGVEYDGKLYKGVSNLGIRPTFGQNRLALEVHVPEVDLGDMYEHRVTVHFYDRIRDEMKFSSVDELLTQIHEDIASMKRYFEQNPL